MRASILLLVLVAVAFAANPSQPTWPTAFSASILANDNLGDMRFFRWFYSQTLNKDRWDGPAVWGNEVYFSTMIFDHVANIQYDVFFQQELATCFTHTINTTIPRPNLAAFQYVGKAIVGQSPVFHWAETVIGQQNATCQYYDDQVSRDPTRLDFSYGTFAGTWNFMEFDDEPQDSSLFTLPSALLAQCNPVQAH